MRKFLIALLLAGVAATPALADPNDNQNNREHAHEQKQARQEARGDRGDRGGNRPAYAAPQREQQYQSRQGADVAQRPQFNGGGRFQQQFEGRRDGYGGQAAEQQRERYAAQRQAYVQQQEGYAAQRQQRQQGERDGAWRQGQGNWQRQGYYQGQRYQGQRYQGQRYQGQGYRDQRWSRDGHSNVRWNRDWRNDQRYDWRRYRDQHRSHFHLGLYVDPFGWGYQSFNIGYRMYPAYYGNQYWIDSAMYDLPYPPPGAAWVRYWNDAVLVDTYTGTVLDVIPGFFW